MSDVLQLLAAAEGSPVSEVNMRGKGDVLLVCEHASRKLPASLGTLGLDAAALEAHVEQRLLDDDAGIHAMLRGDGRPGKPPEARRVFDDTAEAVISLERIAAGGDEAEDFAESVRS